MSVHSLDRGDRAQILAFAGCSLDMKPGSNWVQDAGGLPQYICEVARGILKGGKKDVSSAIAIAVSRMKKWAAGVGVDKDTQAKAAAALAEWEALRVKSKAKKTAKAAADKKDDKKVEASASAVDFDDYVLNLSDYNMDTVRQAFTQRTRKIRSDWRAANPTASYDEGPTSLWVTEVWNNFVIVQSSYGDNPDYYKIPYTVDDNAEVTFGEAIEVKQQYVEVTDADDDGDELTDDALKAMMATAGPCHPTATDRVLALTAPRLSAVQKLLDAANTGRAAPATALQKVLAHTTQQD